ncbi:hypothetical protein SMD44_08767 [Streptomyces alboflavus]|uniref:Uncharacterized protein n=1 Tax=Streptomyces alboflavus TaxID=67267 RepID=A0A1Z1WS71_9ACTN|nr:hypothetical protein [Streptomyces alboflavus]ARX89280.1 hypothetical protein SMD44_08767 [Streptomyces alboflavus]
MEKCSAFSTRYGKPPGAAARDASMRAARKPGGSTHGGTRNDVPRTSGSRTPSGPSIAGTYSPSGAKQ